MPGGSAKSSQASGKGDEISWRRQTSFSGQMDKYLCGCSLSLVVHMAMN